MDSPESPNGKVSNKISLLLPWLPEKGQHSLSKGSFQLCSQIFREVYTCLYCVKDFSHVTDLRNQSMNARPAFELMCNIRNYWF